MSTNPTLDSLHPRRRCHSAVLSIPKKLQEKHAAEKSTDDHLKQRESGFQLYVNGAHSDSSRRPPSVSRQRTANPSNGFRTPTPSHPNPRRRWSSTNQTKIKTEDGSITADIHQQPPARTNHITYRLNVDQSWMPNWYSQIQSNDSSQNLALSLEDLPTHSPHRTYRLSTARGR